MTYLLGIDLGTSSVKAALIEADTLCIAASAAHEYPVYHPQPGYAEQAPEEWWQALVHAVRTAVKDIDPARVKSIGLSGQMHGLVCLGHKQELLHPAIIWADARTTTEVEDLTAFQTSCTAILPGRPAVGFAAASALWLSRHRPDILKKMAVALLPKDYVRYMLTGDIGTDPSDASSTWLYDIAQGDWAPEVVTFCGLDTSQMPPIKPSAAQSGTVTAIAAHKLGLPGGIPVVAGSADLPAQALGHGIVDPGTVLVTVGTGGQVITPCLHPQIDPDQHLYVFQHNLPGRWYTQAAILSAGLSLRWLRGLAGMEAQPASYKILSNLANDIEAGAEGLLFLPYLAGERTPHMDAKASGLFLGLRLHHDVAHLARAVMEGVGFALKENLDLVASEPAFITLSGGITQSPVWCQILADIFNTPLHAATADMHHACVGSAILAGLGLQYFRDVADVIDKLPAKTTYFQPQDTGSYAGRYEQYRRLYPLLKSEMHQLG
jgi:xylulokinase